MVRITEGDLGTSESVRAFEWNGLIFTQDPVTKSFGYGPQELFKRLNWTSKGYKVFQDLDRLCLGPKSSKDDSRLAAPFKSRAVKAKSANFWRDLNDSFGYLVKCFTKTLKGHT